MEKARCNLLGKPFRRMWTTASGEKKNLYGTIVAYDESNPSNPYLVRYSKESRSLMDAIRKQENIAGGEFPETQSVETDSALGGCMDAGVACLTSDCIPLRWLVPDMHHESFDYQENGESTPRLTLHIRDFELVFRVKPSTQLGAGNGVFVSCSYLLNGGGKPLELMPGELIDLGVYAPLRPQDKIKDSVFKLKNFIHSGNCEVWCFRTLEEQYYFDITDDYTGQLHKKARNKIIPHVNEIDGKEQIPSVQARYDPEGSVHYLLGHAKAEDGPFFLDPSDAEREILVDYGPDYESIRIRRSYSRLPPEHAGNIQRRNEEDDTIGSLEIFKEYGAADICNCLNYIYRVFKPNKLWKKSPVERALVATLVLQFQASAIVESLSGNSMDATALHQDFLLRDSMEEVVTRAAMLVRYLYSFWGNPDSFRTSLLSREVYMLFLRHTLGDRDFHNMSSQDFLASVYKNTAH